MEASEHEDRPLPPTEASKERGGDKVLVPIARYGDLRSSSPYLAIESPYLARWH